MAPRHQTDPEENTLIFDCCWDETLVAVWTLSRTVEGGYSGNNSMVSSGVFQMLITLESSITGKLFKKNMYNIYIKNIKLYTF